MNQIRIAAISDLEPLFGFQIALAQESEDISLDPNSLRNGLRSVLTKPELGTYYVEQKGD